MKEQLFTWALTLSAALSGIILNHYLDRKKLQTLNKIQKAIKTYALLNELPSSLSARTIICRELLKNKDFDYVPLLTESPDKTSSLMDELEILIIENFYNLDNLLFEYQKIIFAQQLTLLGIFTGSIRIMPQDFEKLTQDYNTDIGKLNKSFKQALKDQYMNKKPNFWVILNGISSFMVTFFSRKK